MINYQQRAAQAYANDQPATQKKAMAAAIAMDNSLKKGRFAMDQYLAWFSYEALGHRNLLIN